MTSSDANGDTLKVGDIITLEFVVQDIHANNSSPLPDVCDLRHINSDSYQWLKGVPTIYCTKKATTTYNFDMSQQVSDGYDNINKAINDSPMTHPLSYPLSDDHYC